MKLVLPITLVCVGVYLIMPIVWQAMAILHFLTSALSGN